MLTRAVRRGVAAMAVCVLALACSDTGPDAEAPTAHGRAIAALAELMPADARGVLAVDIATLLAGSPEDVTALLAGDAGDPALVEPFAILGSLAGAVDVPDAVTSALLVQTTDTRDGSFLLAEVEGEALDDVVAGPEPRPAGTHGPERRDLYEDDRGNTSALLPGGRLVVGRAPAVESVLDVADGTERPDESAIAPFLDALDGGSHLSFVYGLPALFDEDLMPDRTLRSSAVASGTLDLAEGEVTGALAFHTANAERFVEAYNALNRDAVQAEDATEEPLTLAEPVADGLAQVVVTLPPTPVDPSPDELAMSRNLVKKLFVGMEAHDYAEGVADDGNPAWLDLVVKSEADGDTPPSPGSVFIRWEFRNRAAVEAFEENELPEGFTLAPTRFLESDDPDGELFLALNLYNSGGGSIVNGARAEWDVFVNPPEGADPDAGGRPRFMVVDALAEAVSADPVNLVTPAEPLSHALVDGEVVTRVGRFEDDREVPVFASRFPKPDPDRAEVARFTREMAIGNDYIYWGHGVHDRALYNATTFNHDAYFVDPAQVAIRDDSRWARYLKPEVEDVVYYVNTLEYVASPMANLDSDHLDITPDWLDELKAFKTNGHQEGLMRAAVEQLFRGEGDALVPFRVGNETPSTSYSFAITDPDGLAAALELPQGHGLAEIAPLEGGPAGHHLTLSVRAVDDAVEGTRAEWSVHVDDRDGRPYTMVLDLMTADVGLDPVRVVSLPSEVRHDLVDGEVRTRLSSAEVELDASFPTAGATDGQPGLDWIEAGDEVCHVNGVCDRFYYDAETLDVPVHRPVDVTLDALTTPWDDFIDRTPAVVLYRDNPQPFTVKRWHDLAVPVEELGFAGLEDRTHAIEGDGELVGRATDVVDSAYAYSGDAVVEDGQLRFAIDQQVDNELGTAHIITEGGFDLQTGTGTQTVVDCQGPDLMCSDIESGSSEPFTAQDLDASDLDSISWRVDVAVDLGGTFGTADSASTFTATRVG